MTESKICTCPSGNGSLRHPCPAHPESVELTGVAAKLTFINGRPAMCGCQVEYSSGGGEYSDVIYVTLCAKHSGSAILDLVATNRIALTPEYEGQWHADLYLDREIPLAKAEGATPAEAVLALMSAERIDPEQESVEQAGGDERVIGWRERILAAHPNSDPGFWPDALLVEHMAAEIADLRAALAQPSPTPELPERGTQHRFSTNEQNCRHDFAGVWWNDNGETKTGRECRHCGFFVADVAEAAAEQAEAERPEVEEVSEFEREDIARSAFETAMADGISLDSFLSLSNTLAARYERIVGALRAELQAAEDRADTLEHRMMGMMTRHFAEAWRNRDTQKALDGYLSAGIAQLEQQRDAALSEVERLRQFERICEGLPQDAIDGGWTVQGIRAHSKQLEEQLKVALARVAELERGKVYVEARRCDECQHGGINDSATGVAACHECDWAGPEPEEDKCPGCQRENCMAAACPQCGARYVLVASEEIAAPVAQAQQLHDLDKQCRDDVARALGLRPSQERGFAWSYLLASIKSCVKASEDAAQAQHSVPERLELTDDLKNILGRPNFTCTHLAQALRQIGFVIDRKAEAEQAACLHWMLNHYLANGANWKVHAEAELKAAAPGKEVGHE
ncbi:hypothetical protein PMG1_00047 [Pseudomonas phage PMG1]|uniref:4Fe-4S ferredoxin-type domain-containing protein n=1 Tax=Pseudomonas phage PMG1 TaxID=2992927 RepID=H2BDF1_9CAUD|nr:hypothetical protein PMG1_00047 [Pseudomonas phage PMG1]AEX55918.1 hypothetical protein PMG1_00047 [Pseudomonas phage PMG1]